MRGTLYTRDGIAWTCHVVNGGYEWRAHDGRMSVARVGRHVFAFLDGKLLGSHPTLPAAMDAAKRAAKWREHA